MMMLCVCVCLCACGVLSLFSRNKLLFDIVVWTGSVRSTIVLSVILMRCMWIVCVYVCTACIRGGAKASRSLQRVLIMVWSANINAVLLLWLLSP